MSLCNGHSFLIMETFTFTPTSLNSRPLKEELHRAMSPRALENFMTCIIRAWLSFLFIDLSFVHQILILWCCRVGSPSFCCMGLVVGERTNPSLIATKLLCSLSSMTTGMVSSLSHTLSLSLSLSLSLTHTHTHTHTMPFAYMYRSNKRTTTDI
jgi:hypothetical protein